MALNTKSASLVVNAAILIIFLTLLLNSTTAEAQTNTNLTPADRFVLPSLDGEISFAVNGTYANATTTNVAWNFADLKLNGSTPIKMLIVSAESSSIVITSYRDANTTSRSTARLRYSVERRGQQTFNIGIPAGDGRWGLHPEWGVTVGGVWLGESDGWNITPDGNVTIRGAVGNVSIVHYSLLGLGDDSSKFPFYTHHSVAIVAVASVAVTVTFAILIGVKNKGVKPIEKTKRFID